MQTVWLSLDAGMGCLDVLFVNGSYVSACPGCMAEPSRKALERYLKEEG